MIKLQKTRKESVAFRKRLFSIIKHENNNGKGICAYDITKIIAKQDKIEDMTTLYRRVMWNLKKMDNIYFKEVESRGQIPKRIYFIR